jgi:hypothetical protein
MKKCILIAGAAALAFAAPAFAGAGNGPGEGGNAHAAIAHVNAGGMAPGHRHNSMTDGDAHGTRAHGWHQAALHNHGRLYALSAHGRCPPGLARMDNGCMPPGQAKKLYNVGQRYNRNFGTLWSYDQIPTDLRSRYSFDQNDRFYYSNGYLYQVDPRTRLIQQVVSLLLH